MKTPKHGVMPAWLPRLGDDAVKQLAVFVHSLARRVEVQDHSAVNPCGRFSLVRAGVGQISFVYEQAGQPLSSKPLGCPTECAASGRGLDADQGDLSAHRQRSPHKRNYRRDLLHAPPANN